MNVSGSPLSPAQLQLDQLFGGWGQDVMPGFSNQDHVFDPDSTFFWNVDAWLNRDDHSRLKFPGLALGHPRRLMHLDSHSMAGRVGKIRIEPRFFQHGPPGAVHFPRFHSGPDSFDGFKLCFSYCVIHAAMHPRDRPHMHSTSHVGTVTSEYNTVVEDYKSFPRNSLR